MKIVASIFFLSTNMNIFVSEQKQDLNVSLSNSHFAFTLTFILSYFSDSHLLLLQIS